MTLLLLIWLVLGALLILSLRPLLGGWGTPAIVVWPPYILLGLALAAAALRTPIRLGPPPTLRSLRPLLIFALGGGLLFTVHPVLARFSDTLVFRTRLAHSQAAYDDLATHLAPDSTRGAWHWQAGLRYVVDSGPPLRVAILQPGRAYDGVEVALYDPLGPPDPSRVIPGAPHSFEGRLENCHPVQPRWYRCLIRQRGP